MVYFWLPRLLQSTEPVVDRVDAAHINAAQIDSGQAVEPPRQRVEAVTLKEAQRLGLICRVRQEQRHHAVQAIAVIDPLLGRQTIRSAEHTPELQSLMRTSYAVFSLTTKNTQTT